MWLVKRNRGRESKLALAQAKRHLKKTEDRAPEVAEQAKRLRTFREVNHIAEQLVEIMGGPK